VYQPNPAPLEDISEKKSSYKSWPVTKVPQKFKKVEYKPSNQLLEGESVVKSDYRAFGKVERVKLLKKQEEYIPPTGDLLDKSRYQEEFKAYKDLRVPKRLERTVHRPVSEDREFTSTAHAAYQPIATSFLKRPVHQPFNRFIHFDVL
jgi:hypothetical protein